MFVDFIYHMSYQENLYVITIIFALLTVELLQKLVSPIMCDINVCFFVLDSI